MGAFYFRGNMGGAASDAWKDVSKGIEGIPVIGKGLNAALQVATPVGWLGNAVAGTDRGIQGYKTLQNAPRDAAASASAASRDQAAKAADIQRNLLLQPKKVTPDNFLANKASQLANLRLGMASTITGAGGAPDATLSAPSLSGNYPGKTKLGS